ncbi:MAG: endonuclease/exonuclease/phosphatase family protein [Rhodobacteraceae bacterium]|nr:endonuclease/exonuclease/phosphatase family protein [Paracoccaceae bacterium]
MGISAGKPVYAWNCDGADRPPRAAQTRPPACPRYLGFCAGLIAFLLAGLVAAEPVRIATYNVGLGQDGPGRLVRLLARGDDPVANNAAAIIARVSPDILLLTDFDYDLGGVALALFAETLAGAGAAYPYRMALAPNSGLASGLDLDGDRRRGGPGDALGHGAFPGAAGMALLSRLPIRAAEAQNHGKLLWRDLDGAALPVRDGAPFYSPEALAVLPVSSRGHWVVPVDLPDGTIVHLLASHPTPPVFDGRENRNGLRNRDEIRLWTLLLDGGIDGVAAWPRDRAFVILGDLNADPEDGEGDQAAIRALLAHPLVQDAAPASSGAAAAATAQGGPNKRHKGAAALDTADWDEGRTDGNLRVDYVLPSTALRITGAGVFWPAPGEDGFDLVGHDGSIGPHHRLVWVDIVPDG